MNAERLSRIARHLACGSLLLSTTGVVQAQTPAAETTVAPERTSIVADPVAEQDYRLMPRDTVRVQIVEELENNIVQRITMGGEISVPMLGSVKVGGLTLREVEERLAKAYTTGGYFMMPQVIVSIETYAPRTVQVLGQVARPDEIAFIPERLEMGIVQAITQAGGFTRTARTDAVRVIRTVNGREEQITINLAAYLEGKDNRPEFKLLPGDTVFVPERVF